MALLNLIDIIDQNTLWPLAGGIHPPQMKQLSNQAPIARLPLADEYWVPLPQVGDSALLAVQVGDQVLKGQPLTQAAGAMYCAAHAPTSGAVTHIEPRASNHASGLPQLTCVIAADGKDNEVSYAPATLASLSKEQVLRRIREAGIAGMGGAMFPSHIKLNPANAIDLLIINGVECEPYITSDDRLMREHAKGIVAGIEIIQQLVHAKRIVIAIEDNKAEAAASMTTAVAQHSALKSLTSVRVIPTKYPSGGEKQLIQILTGQEVPSGSIPAQLGIVVHNVGTSLAIRDAVLDGKPLLERVVTVTGGNLTQNANYWLPIGTPVNHVLRQCGIKDTDNAEVIVGGPMMGYTLFDAAVPVLKGTNCLLVPSIDELSHPQQERACIRCGECAQVCPADLLPQQLFWHAKAQEYDKATAFNLQDCIECGCCAYVCPSDIPLVEYYRVAKAAIRQANADKVQADQAKIRYEARLARLEQEKQEREAKAREAAERRKASMSGDEKDAVAAALARVKAKKAETTPEPASPTPTAASDDKQSQVSAAIARAKAKKAQQADDVAATDTTSTAGDDKKSQVAAAIARAKAKKAQQTDDADATDTGSTANDDKKSQVAAAIARAKAKKAQQADDADATDTASTASDDKKSQVAAAIARAKAKKAQQAGEAESTEATASSMTDDAEDNTNPATDKQAQIAAAVARAKAKKAAEQAADAAEASPAATEKVDDETAPQQSADASKQARVAAAVARAKAKKAQQSTASEAAIEPDDSSATDVDADAVPQQDANDSKQARIAAAVAKAKAKKAGLTDDTETAAEPEAASAMDTETEVASTPTQNVDDSKQARIAAAVAKAKAKKAGLTDDTETAAEPETASVMDTETEVASTPTQNVDDSKQARIAAAVAKAKAKKVLPADAADASTAETKVDSQVEQPANVEPESPTTAEVTATNAATSSAPSAADAKKARVAAAIAKAKAKKALADQENQD
ncbi:electron transport complex subunit RsxC [Shewanella sp. A3A]|nr:electron transport complex subunit RsxC [Shewanella ferrihydritica]